MNLQPASQWGLKSLVQSLLINQTNVSFNLILFFTLWFYLKRKFLIFHSVKIMNGHFYEWKLTPLEWLQLKFFLQFQWFHLINFGKRWIVLISSRFRVKTKIILVISVHSRQNCNRVFIWSLTKRIKSLILLFFIFIYHYQLKFLYY